MVIVTVMVMMDLTMDSTMNASGEGRAQQNTAEWPWEIHKQSANLYRSTSGILSASTASGRKKAHAMTMVVVVVKAPVTMLPCWTHTNHVTHEIYRTSSCVPNVPRTCF